MQFIIKLTLKDPLAYEENSAFFSKLDLDYC